MTVTNGAALERFIRSRWGRPQGGIRRLAALLHVAPDKVYGWFKNIGALDTDELQRLANLLEVKRYEIVAAMDGEAPLVPLNEDLIAAISDLIDRRLDERLGPPRADRRGSGAA